MEKLKIEKEYELNSLIDLIYHKDFPEILLEYFPETSGNTYISFFKNIIVDIRKNIDLKEIITLSEENDTLFKNILEEIINEILLRGSSISKRQLEIIDMFISLYYIALISYQNNNLNRYLNRINIIVSLLSPRKSVLDFILIYRYLQTKKTNIDTSQIISQNKKYLYDNQFMNRG